MDPDKHEDRTEFSESWNSKANDIQNLFKEQYNSLARLEKGLGELRSGFTPEDEKSNTLKELKKVYHLPSNLFNFLERHQGLMQDALNDTENKHREDEHESLRNKLKDSLNGHGNGEAIADQWRQILSQAVAGSKSPRAFIFELIVKWMLILDITGDLNEAI